MKTKWIAIVICIVSLAACTPSQEDIQATVQVSIAQTENAKPTETRLPTHTPIPTVTATFTPSPSPTPDMRLIDIDPRELLLQKSDLPIEGQYFLPPGEGWISPSRNAEIVSAWTVKEGQEYLAETGRIDGWYVYYNRGKSGVLMPELYYDNVIIYSSIEGAQVVITKYENRRIIDDDFQEIDAPLIGDASRAFTKREVNSGGEIRVWILVSFSYRNIAHTIGVWGWEKEVSLDFAVTTANKLLDGLKQLPLSNTVTFTP